MKLGKIYRKVVDYSKEVDPRGAEEVKENLERKKKEFDDLDEEDKEFFDKDKLWNPYSDTRILNGASEIEVKSSLVGIDIGAGELLLADRMKNSGENIDVVISHHPAGRALASIYEVMDIQPEILAKFGVPISIAEGLMSARKKEVQRKLLPSNHTRVVDIAANLGVPFLCAHTVADNHVVDFLQSKFDDMKPKKVKEVLDFLNGLPEYKNARGLGVGPKLIAGEESRKCGKILVDMTGGTEGSKEIFENVSQAGVGTMVCMHLSESHFKKAKKAHINIIIAGHIASDTLGMNILLDKLNQDDKELSFKTVSGFKRVDRTK